MQVIVINTPKATERLEFQTAQLGLLGLDFHRLVAFTPETLPDSIPASYWRRWHRPLSPTERARFLSHRSAWDAVAESGPALILEDDAALAHVVPTILNAVVAQPDMDHLSLETRGRRKLMGPSGEPIAPGVTRRRLYVDREGAAAYILWPSGAKILLKHAARRAAAAERVICQTYRLRSYQTDPACAVQLDLVEKYGMTPVISAPSQIARVRPALPHTPSQLIRRTWSKTHGAWHAFTRGFVADLEYVPVKPEFFDI